MDYQLRDRTAFITGGSKGIGRATADLLCAEGVRVAIADIEPPVSEPSYHSALTFILADLATAKGVDEAIQQVLKTFHGPPAFLVNNVGSASPVPFEALSDEGWQNCFELNFMSHVRVTRQLIGRMAERGGASIVNLSSDLAKQPEPMPIDYGSMKAALLYFTKALASQYSPAVRVNAICPGPVWTDLWTKPGGVVSNLKKTYSLDADQALEKYLKERQLKLGLGKPENIASIIAFLLSPQASWITGAVLDAGGTIRGIF
jgi:NAD(P)-dependent dehydrogenase (short-subunit alcohol dehydrogenase family)